MALNKEVFRTRAITALLFVIVMVAGLFTNAWIFVLLFSIVYCGGLWEYFNLSENINGHQLHLFARIGIIILGLPILFFAANKIPSIASLGLFENSVYGIALAGFLLASYGIFISKNISVGAAVHSLVGFGYLSVGIASIIYLAALGYKNTTAINWLPYGVLLPIFVIGCMWVNDTMAYIVGSLIGKTPLSKISPKKTWEGTLGGIVLCGLVAGLLMNKFSAEQLPLSLLLWIVLAIINAITGTVGDLLESKLKRMADVKDSGTFMPGHGGFLDRFDSMLLAAPIFLFAYMMITNL